MGKNKLVCPGCHKVYSLVMQNPQAVMGKEFRCPKCGFSAPFSMLLGGKGKAQDNPALHTHIAGGGLAQSVGNAISGLKTKVAQIGQHGVTGQLALVVESTGARFPLQPGVYILGRASSDSKATLRLAPDPYMSRQHARLVVDISHGKTQCQLSGMASTNPIFVNNRKLAADGAVTLKPGDEILLGMTKITLKA